MANQYRDWCFTLNNPTQTDEEFLEQCKNLSHIKYLVFQREQGAKTKTVHFQGYIEFTMGKRFDTMKGYFPQAHIEERKAKLKSKARDYCMQETKDKNGEQATRISGPYEFGDFVENGQRSDIENIVQRLCNGDTPDEIKKDFPTQYFKNYKNIHQLRQEYLTNKYKNERRIVEITYIHGTTGLGKTRYVLDKYGDENVYVVDDPKHPFDFYESQDVILFDEFRSQYDISKMLRWLDIYPLVLPARYNNRQACYTKIYLTSNIPLEKQYPKVKQDEPATFAAFCRRVKTIINFDKQSQPRQMKLIPVEDEDLPF